MYRQIRKEKNNMATRLELANKKLERLESEIEKATQNLFEHVRSANGQPMNDKRGGSSWFKRSEQLEEKNFDLMKQILDQKEYIEKLENKKINDDAGLNANGGLKVEARNLGAWEKRLSDQETAKRINKENGNKVSMPVEIDGKEVVYSFDKYNKAHNAVMIIKDIQKLVEVKLDPKFQEMVDSGKIKQWNKKPQFYFVTGLRKVALISNGKGQLTKSDRYYPYSENDINVVNELLK